MGALTIGRVGLDLDMDHPAQWDESRGLDERDLTVSGYLRSDSVANTKVLRTELLEQQGQLIAVTYSLDSHFDGFYILGDVRIGTVISSYRYRGLFPYEIGLFRIGGESRVELQSNITGTVLENNFGLLEGETKPFIAPPIGHLAFDWNVSGLNDYVRVTEDGPIIFYTSNGDFSADATWGADPATYYSGSVDLYVDGRLRSGLDVPNSTNWSVDNGLVRLTPEPGDTGRVQIECWDGAWSSLKDFAFEVGGSSKIDNFKYMSVARNTPESVIIRLVGQTASVSRHVIDLHLRRGFTMVMGVWNSTYAPTAMKVVRDTNEASTSVTPPGASAEVGLRATSDDADGNRFVLFTPQDHTNDLTAGGISVASTQLVKFAFGFEIGGSTASLANVETEMALQYFGYVGERVRAVWR